MEDTAAAYQRAVIRTDSECGESAGDQASGRAESIVLLQRSGICTKAGRTLSDHAGGNSGDDSICDGLFFVCV